jgi:hypothetical protein
MIDKFISGASIIHIDFLSLKDVSPGHVFFSTHKVYVGGLQSEVIPRKKQETLSEISTKPKGLGHGLSGNMLFPS